jgi:hypothetical protein
MNENKKIGLKRDTIDKYYTKPNIVEMCLNKMKEYIVIKEDDIIIEPSAGNGSFMEGIQELCNNAIFFDIEPEHENIMKQDYFTWNGKIEGSAHIIGNPPFGRQSSLAIKFIKKSCEYADSISFILPRSFKKDSLKKHFSLNYHLIYEMDIPDNGFLVDNKEHDVPCVFQIWKKMETPRQISEKLFPHNFEFVDKTDDADISFRRVGVNAGKIDKNILDKSDQSHYFIKFVNMELTDDILEKLEKIDFECSKNTVGPKSISKQELIKGFIPVLIESEIKRAEDFLKEGPNGSERMAILSTIEKLKNKMI